MAMTVTFNVGGSLFTTTYDTLLKEPTSRLSILAHGTLPVVHDASGAIFIDRDPRHFPTILTFMREGCCSAPGTAIDLAELLHEVKYYQLSGFEAWLNAQSAAVTASGPAAAHSSHLFPATTSTVFQPLGFSCPTGTLPQTAQTFPGTQVHIRLPSGTQYVPTTLSGASGLPGTYTATMNASPGQSPQLYHPMAGPAAPASAGPVSPPTYVREPQPYASTSPRPVSVHVPMSPQTSSRKEAFREAFLKATASGPQPSPAAAYSLPPSNDSHKWTSKYLRQDEALRRVADTLMELTFLAPHRSLQVGKVQLTITSPCDHSQAISLVGGAREQLRGKHQVVRVSSSSGWTFEMDIKPGCSEDLFDKYNVVPYVQDNWFVLCAVLKDQFNVLLEEDNTSRPQCMACRRTHLGVTVQKIM